jgi:hypothetical protein
MMRSKKRWMIAAGIQAVGALLVYSLAAAQETPTPPPWDQATLDAAVQALFTQTAAAPHDPGAPLPTALATSAASNAPILTAANFDQIEPLAHYDFEADDHVQFRDNWVLMPDRWLTVSTYEYDGDNWLMTIWLIDREALNTPAYRIPVPSPPDNIFHAASIEIVEGTLYYEHGANILHFYDLNTAALSGSIEAPADFLTIRAWKEANAVVGFLENDEILVWDVTTYALLHRWPAPPGMESGFVLVDGTAITMHSDTSVHAIDLQTGTLLQSWEDSIVSYHDVVKDPDRFHITTGENELLAVDSRTLQPIDQLIMNNGFLYGPVIANTPFVILWNDARDVRIRSFDSPMNISAPFDAQVFQTNRNGDLLLTRDETETTRAYNLYHLSEAGLERLTLPDELRSPSDNRFLYFLGGDQLVSVEYQDNPWHNLRVTLWGVPE